MELHSHPVGQEARETFGLRGYRVSDPDKSAARRRDILRAAARVFTANGYFATTMDQIAQELGLTKGVVYYYFRSKEEILFEIVSTAITRAQENLDRVLAT